MIKRAIALLFCLLIVSPAWAAPTADADSACSGAISNAGSPDLTCAHTTGTLTNGLMLFTSTIDALTRELSSCSYNSVAMTRATKVSHSTNNTNTELWYLVNPSSGTNNLTCEFSSATVTAVAGTIATFSGVNQATPLTGTANTEFTAATTSSLNVTCAAGNLAFDTLGSISSANYTATGSNVELREVDNGTDNTNSTSTLAGAGTTTMSWSMDATENGVQIGTCINAAAAVIPMGPIFFQ